MFLSGNESGCIADYVLFPFIGRHPFCRGSTLGILFTVLCLFLIIRDGISFLLLRIDPWVTLSAHRLFFKSAGCEFPLGRATSLLENSILETFWLLNYFIEGVFPGMLGFSLVEIHPGFLAVDYVWLFWHLCTKQLKALRCIIWIYVIIVNAW